MPSHVVVGIHQAEPGGGITPAELARFRDAGAKILVFPEYFWTGRDDRSSRDAFGRYEENLAALKTLSADDDWILVGGTMVEPAAARAGAFEASPRGETTPSREAVSVDGTTPPLPAAEPPVPWHNTCVVVHRGEEIARYRKINLMPRERENHAIPGESFVLVDAHGLKLAPVVCADVLNPDTFDHVARLGADLILAPIASPFLPDDTPAAKDRRDREIFVAGAVRANAPIVKACGVGDLFGHPLQGRSLVATPDGILFRTPFDAERSRRQWIVDVPLFPPPIRAGSG